MTRMENKDWNKEAAVAATHLPDSEDSVALEAVLGVVDSLSEKLTTFSSNSLVVEIPSRTSLTMILSWVLEGDRKCSRRVVYSKREEILSEAWASEEDSLMTTMDSDLEADSVEEVCSSKCRWVAAWEEVEEDLVLSSPHPFQVEALHSQSKRRHI